MKYCFHLGYVLISAELSFFDAKNHCLSINRILMEPKTQQALDDTEALRQQSSSTYLWLGGGDYTTEGNWVWESDGSPIDRNRFWADNQPQGGTLNEDFLCIGKNTAKFYDCWNASIQFICEAP